MADNPTYLEKVRSSESGGKDTAKNPYSSASEENNIYFLYRHIRPDTGEPFYVGIGKQLYKYNGWSSLYRRAYAKSDRNDIWKKILKKNNNKYEIEILFCDMSYEYIIEKEKELIKLYGRINNDTGILANMTDGGEGTTGFNFIHTEEHNRKKSEALMGHYVSEETRYKQRIAKLGGTLSEEHKRKISENNGKASSRRCRHIETGMEFNSLKEGCDYFNYVYGSQNRAMQKNFTTKKFEYLS